MADSRGIPPGRAVLVYDAGCPVCRKAVDALEAEAVPGSFEWLACGSEEALRRFPGIRTSACLQAVHLVLPGGAVRSGAAAAPEILARIPRYRRFAPCLRLPVVRWLAAAVYRLVARNRYRLGHLLFP
jgi:predicted DCC family thiol-disulfide oxidoreductase YuxK